MPEGDELSRARTGGWRLWALGAVADASALAVLQSAGAAWRDAQLGAFAAGSLVMFSAAILSRSVSSSEASKSPRLRRLLFPALLALFFRGGLVGWILPVAGPVVLLSLTVVATWIVFRSLAELLAREGSAAGPHSEERWIGILQGLTAYTVLLRLVYLQPVELLHEEAYYWLYAQHLDLGYLDHPPLVAWLIRSTTTVFGQSEFGIRIGALCLWLGTAAFVFGLTRRMFDRLTAWVAVGLLAFLPFYFGVGVVMTPDAPLVFCWAGALYCAYRAIAEDDRRAVLAFGFLLGLGLLAKYTIGFLGLGMLVFVVLDPDSRVWLRRWQTWAAVALALLVFSPALAWNATHEWMSFGFQVGGRLTGSFRFSLHKLLGSALFMLTPAGLLGLWNVWRRRGMVSPEGRRTFRMMTTCTLVPLAVLVLMGTFRSTKLNWTGPLWLALFPYLARWTILSVETVAGVRRVRLRPIMLATGIALVLVLYGWGLYHLSVAWPGVQYPPNLGGTGWRHIGMRIEELAAEGERETGHRPLVVGMYGDTTPSWATFYRMRAAGDRTSERAVRETVGRHLFGEWSHMFEFWVPAEGVRADSLLLIGGCPEDVELPTVSRYVERLGDVHSFVHFKNGRPSGTYYYRWAFRYAWHPPEQR